MKRKVAIEVGVEDLEGICQIEVTLHGEGSLVGLELAFEIDEIAEGVDELIFIAAAEDRLALGRSSGHGVHGRSNR